MIIGWLSRYRPRYLRSLTYMLQATEYNARDYFDWYLRTTNFSNVEKRKRLKKTPKALLVLLSAWLVALLVYGAIASALVSLDGLLRVVVVAASLLTAPWLIAIGILVPLGLVRLLAQKPVEFFIIRDARKRLAQHQGTKIAIAGSFGKTSMREILKSILEQGKITAAPSFSYNTPLGISKFIKGLKGNEEILIFELGEYYPGDVRRLCKLVNPDMGVITGVNEAHLLKMKSLDRTVGTIFELADWLGNKPLYVNQESDLAAKAADPQHILYSRHGAGQWKILSPSTDLGGTTFSLARGDHKLKVSSKLLGLHQLGPLAAAADIAKSLGLSDRQIKDGIAKTKPFDHRLEPKQDDAGVITLDDSYNGNPSGVKAVIDFLAALKGYRRFYITPGLVETGNQAQQIHHTIGQQLAAAGIEKVILIRNSVTPHIERGLTDAHYKGDIIWFDDALSAYSALPHMTVKGDVVLLQNDWPDQYA